MFKEVISQTPFNTAAANEYFDRVGGDLYLGDVSLIATLRALVFPRMPEGDRMFVKFRQNNFNGQVISAMPADSAVQAICVDWGLGNSPSGLLMIHNFTSTKSENNVACMELLKKRFCTVYPGWRRFDDIAQLMGNTARVLCFMNPERKSTILFVEKLDLKKLHYIQAAILGLVPWYYQMGTAVSEDEMNLMQSLREKTPNAYLECLGKLVKQFDFEALRLKRMLTGFETRQARAEIENLRGSIDRYVRAINSLNDQVGQHISAMNDASIRLMGLEQSVARAEDNSELLDYFLCNRRVVLESVEGSWISYYVKDYLEYYDEEMVLSNLRNQYSCVYQYVDDVMTAERMKRLIKAAFVDNKIRIRVCAAYSFDINGSIHPQTGHDFGADADSYIPNPHINRYQCMGNYSTPVNRFIRDRNYINAIEQTVASAKSLNWADTTVMREFFRTLMGQSDVCRNNRGFELPDGRVVTPLEAVQWLEEQENAQRTEENHE